jgi:hypothetical protein
MEKKIWFDMDGTIADLYGVPGWLDYLMNDDTYPYNNAEPMLNFSLLARYLNKLQREGWQIGIISWTSKSGTDIYNGEIALTKLVWLHQHLKSVSWDEIKIVKYGTNKYNECGGGILFDDEERNRNEWLDESYEPSQIFEVLKGLME